MIELFKQRNSIINKKKKMEIFRAIRMHNTILLEMKSYLVIM